MLQGVGIVVAVGGVVAASLEPLPEGGGRKLTTGVGLALLAALGFGSAILGLNRVSQAGVVWGTLSLRLTVVPIVLIAALMDNPDVLILDEPLSGLDVTTVLVVKSLIQALSAQGKSVFNCSHILEVVEKVCSHLIVLRKGHVLAHGPTSAVREKIGKSSLEDVFLELVEDVDVTQIANEIVEVMVSS